MKMDAAAVLRPLISRISEGDEFPVRVEFYDGSALGPVGAPATVRVRTPRAIQRLITAPGELGLARAYVSGDLEVEGDLEEVIALGDRRPDLRLGVAGWLAAARAALGLRGLSLGAPPPPPEEARLRGRRHSRERDAAAISHHYDVSNDFFRLVLGPSLTYSCAYFATESSSLEQAQEDKHELICTKLRLTAGERLLDVGCGWGSLAIHAAARHGVRVVGVTLSRPQAELAAKRAADAGLSDLVEIRVQDERDVDDGPYDAVASVGMFEHVGAARLDAYFGHLHALLRPGGRLLNHGIYRPAGQTARFAPRGFVNRYVFPDGELRELGEIVSIAQRAGFEVRDVEGLRDHYALTLRRWVTNLEAHREEAVRLAGEGRYRVWRMYMAGSARRFEQARLQVHQVLAVRSHHGRAGLPLRRDHMVLP